MEFQSMKRATERPFIPIDSPPILRWTAPDLGVLPLLYDPVVTEAMAVREGLRMQMGFGRELLRQTRRLWQERLMVICWSLL